MSENILEKQLIDIIKDEEMAEYLKLAKVDMLVKLGVNVNAMYGANSVLLYAKSKEANRICELLEKNGAKEIFDEKEAKEIAKKISLICDDENPDINEIKELIDMGAYLKAKGWWGRTTLMDASKKGLKEVVELLIQKGANVNAKDNYRYTPIFLAAMNGHKEIVEILIQNGANVNARDKDGVTVLMEASRKGYRDIIRLLIQNGANVNARDRWGKSAILYANDDVKIRKVIINAVKKRNIKTSEKIGSNEFDR